jgi:O-antigen/teichoic acid export membrane protein
MNDYYNGIYGIAVKIYTVVKNVFVAIFSVTVYRLTACIAKKDYDEYHKVLNGVTSYFILLAFPAVTGMIAYAEYICMVFGDGEYIGAVPSLRILAVALLFAVFGGIATRCINVPLGYEVVNTKVTLIVAIENVLLNFPFIIFYAERGAAFTTAIAEFTVLLLCALKLKKEHVKLPGLVNVKHIRDAIIGCVWICVTYVIVAKIEAHYLLRMILGIAMSVIGYALVLFAMRNEIFIDIVESKLRLRKK